jgi:hypothetical protein
VNSRVFAGSAYTPKKTSAFFRNDSVILSVRGPEWKLIRERLFLRSGARDSRELFRVRSDPEEMENVAEQRPDVVEKLDRSLDEWLKEIEAESIRTRLQE